MSYLKVLTHDGHFELKIKRNWSVPIFSHLLFTCTWKHLLRWLFEPSQGPPRMIEEYRTGLISVVTLIIRFGWTWLKKKLMYKPDIKINLVLVMDTYFSWRGKPASPSEILKSANIFKHQNESCRQEFKFAWNYGLNRVYNFHIELQATMVLPAKSCSKAISVACDNYPIWNSCCRSWHSKS